MGNVEMCCGARAADDKDGNDTTKTDKDLLFFKENKKENVFQSNVEKFSSDNATKKKKFVLDNPTKKTCQRCKKAVYPVEISMNSKEQIFHKLCLRCGDCGCSLKGKEPVPEIGAKSLNQGQYRVMDNQQLLCAKHGSIVEKNVIKGRPKTQKQESHRVVCSNETVAAQKEQVQDQLTLMMSDYVPVCCNCGYGFSKNDKVLVRGSEKLHEKCPTTISFDDGSLPADLVTLQPAVHAKRAMERIVISVGCSYSKIPYSFMFNLNQELREKCLLQQSREDWQIFPLRYDIDTSARVKRFRAIPDVNCDPEKLNLKAEIRETQGFTNIDPETKIEYIAKPNVYFFGKVNENETLTLTHDGKLILGDKILSLNTKTYQFLDKNPGFVVDNVIFKTTSWYSASIWVECLLQKSKEEHIDDSSDKIRFTLHLFKSMGGSVQRVELNLVLWSKNENDNKLIGCVNPCIMYISPLNDPPQEKEGFVPIFPTSFFETNLFFDNRKTLTDDDEDPPPLVSSPKKLAAMLSKWENASSSSSNNGGADKNASTSKKSTSKIYGKAPLKCFACNESVYETELMTIEGKKIHKQCFKCCHCQRKLSLSNFSILQEKIYCKEHFMEIFKRNGGKYDF